MAFSEEDILRVLMKSRERISAAAWVVVRDTQAAEDIFQNVALKAMTKDVLFKAEGALLSWAFITARREGIDWLRRHRNETAGLDTGILEIVEQQWLAESASRGEARVEALRDCIDTMPDRSRRLLRLRYFEGYSCGEVAEQLDCGLNAIYKRLSRLCIGLRECIERRMKEPGATQS